MLNNQTIALAGAGILKCRLNPRSYSSHTWLHVLSRSTGKETIWAWADGPSIWKISV